MHATPRTLIPSKVVPASQAAGSIFFNCSALTNAYLFSTLFFNRSSNSACTCANNFAMLASLSPA
jgi:hypothetical protein